MRPELRVVPPPPKPSPRRDTDEVPARLPWYGERSTQVFALAAAIFACALALAWCW
jgi:hypothetical protein